MSHLISAVMASTILGIVSVPIAQLSVASVRTRASSELHHEAEQSALSVRKAAAQANSMEINGSDLLLNGSAHTLPSGCNVIATASISKVTCTSSRGGLTSSSSQPLYSSSDLAGSSSICWSGYQSQNASNNNQPSTTYISDAATLNQELSNPGNSGWGFVQVHELSTPDCQAAIANGGLLIHNNAGSSDPGTTTLCSVSNYINITFNDDPTGTAWNSGSLSSNNYSKKKPTRKTVVSQSPEAGSNVPCDSTITLNF